MIDLTKDELDPGNPYSNPWNWVADVPEKGGELIQLDHGDLIEYDIHGQVLMRYTGPSRSDETVSLKGLRAVVEAAAKEADRAAVRRTLDEKAEEVRRELVCCDVYERHHETGLPEYVIHHAICYWGEAAARLVEESDDA